jgi:hypothetical protein
MPRGFKHFATSPTHPHAGNSARLRAAQYTARAKNPLAVKKFSGCR